MAYHFVAISSHFLGGTRIGWHYASEGRLDTSIIESFFEKCEEKLNNSDFGVHKLSTDSLTWESVIQKDSFFKDVIIAEDADAFISCVREDEEISALDIAKYILAYESMTHLKLQKLIYLIYADYLEEYGISLFKEPIVAYKYGPVIEEVYAMYKKFGATKINDLNGPKLKLDKLSFPPVLMKIISYKDSGQLIDSITSTLNKYSKLSPRELVDLTHVQGGPWKRVYKPRYNMLIDDATIEKYHKLEGI
ncbi:Panacea domain-containing protein [Carnobacterium maltaromaticum]|uniref:Panacea domain-containing protein n=1 Tax=Carnobacterium maltaromaticum TaxID=2751 RepID=UPI0039AF55AB